MKKELIKFLPIITIPFSINAIAEEQTNAVSAGSSDSRLTLDSMAVTADVAEAKLGGVDLKPYPWLLP